MYKLAYKEACNLFLWEEQRSVHCVAGCAPPQLRKGTSAVLPGASASIKVEADLFSIVEEDQAFGASQVGLCLLAGPLEYKGHSELLWEVDRQRE